MNFFWTDKTGGGRTNNFSEERLLKAFDKEDTDFNGVEISEWMEECEVGDVWENVTSRIIRTE